MFDQQFGLGLRMFPRNMVHVPTVLEPRKRFHKSPTEQHSSASADDWRDEPRG